MRLAAGRACIDHPSCCLRRLSTPLAATRATRFLVRAFWPDNARCSLPAHIAATGGTKPATLETGAVVNVPMFINVGEEIMVDTREDIYLSRQNGASFS